MPVENLEEEGLPKNPKLELAQLKFHLETPKHKNDEAAKSTIMEAIKTDSKIALLGFVNFDLSPLKQSWDESVCSRLYVIVSVLSAP